MKALESKIESLEGEVANGQKEKWMLKNEHRKVKGDPSLVSDNYSLPQHRMGCLLTSSDQLLTVHFLT